MKIFPNYSNGVNEYSVCCIKTVIKDGKEKGLYSIFDTVTGEFIGKPSYNVKKLLDISKRYAR